MTPSDVGAAACAVYFDEVTPHSIWGYREYLTYPETQFESRCTTAPGSQLRAACARRENF